MNDHFNPANSPSEYLGQPDKRYLSGLNRKPFAILFALCCIVIGTLVFSYQARLRQHSDTALEPKQHTATNAAQSLISGESDGVIQALSDPVMPEYRARIATNKAPAKDYSESEKLSDSEAKLIQRRLELEEKARQSNSRVTSAGISVNSPPPKNSQVSALIERLAGTEPTGREGVEALLSRLGGVGLPAGLNPDSSDQSEKVSFLEQQTKASYRLSDRRSISKNPYELKTSALIPCVMVGGINSDLPGVVRGQVSQNVYDSATGNHLLIPQGTFVIGRHDSRVSYGKRRILMAWNRLTYPDASTHDIGTMPGADEGGYPGFSDEVDNHYTRIFGSAIFMSIFSAGVQLSQPDPQPFQAPSTQQTIAGALGQNLGQLGIDITRRNLTIQPTLIVHPGYRFNIVVTKDFSFSEPYVDRIAQPNTPNS